MRSHSACFTSPLPSQYLISFFCFFCLAHLLYPYSFIPTPLLFSSVPFLSSTICNFSLLLFFLFLCILKQPTTPFFSRRFGVVQQHISIVLYQIFPVLQSSPTIHFLSHFSPSPTLIPVPSCTCSAIPSLHGFLFLFLFYFSL